MSGPAVSLSFAEYDQLKRALGAAVAALLDVANASVPRNEHAAALAGLVDEARGVLTAARDRTRTA